MSRSVMAVPRPHLMVLGILKANQALDPAGYARWLDAVPEDIRGAVPGDLLFVPLLERGLVEASPTGLFGGGRYCRITRAGLVALAFGYMPIEQVPLAEAHIDEMKTLPPSPTLILPDIEEEEADGVDLS